ncbi:hypothetical protein [Pistricoccus aurantiacus]|uniref:hypothetical protein n=1 Tax=Pistricoccus aurantiacus TaxID=1883414 RepID=UPI00363BBF80
MDIAKFRALVFLAGPPYWFTVAIIYAGTYWTSFGINVLEFATLADVAKMAVLPVVVSAVVLIFNTLLQTLLDLFEFKKRRWLYFFISAIGITLLFILGIGPTLVLLIFILVVIVQAKNVSPKIFINTGNNNILAILLLVILPGGAYFNASLNAKNVLEGQKYSYTIIDEKKLRYVGYIGEYWFLFDGTTESIKVIRASNIESMTLFFYPEFPKYQPFIKRCFDEGTEIEKGAEPAEKLTDFTNNADFEDTLSNMPNKVRSDNPDAE